MAERLLTAEEAAKHCGVIVQTIYQWTLAGLPKKRKGRRNYFKQSDLDAYRGIIDEAEDPKLPDESPPPDKNAPKSPPRGEIQAQDDLDDLRGDDLKDALNREKARKERIAAQALQTKLDREMGRLIPISDVEEILSSFMARTKGALVNLPITMSPRMALCADAAEAEQALEQWTSKTLRDLKELLSGVLEGAE